MTLAKTCHASNMMQELVEANVRSDSQNLIIVTETHVYMKASSATMQRGAFYTVAVAAHAR